MAFIRYDLRHIRLMIDLIRRFRGRSLLCLQNCAHLAHLQTEDVQMKMRTILCAAALSLASTGCSTWDKLNDTERGAVIGGGTGAAVGTAVSDGSAGGALVGGAVGALGGGLIGHEMDEHDRDHDRDRYRRY